MTAEGGERPAPLAGPWRAAAAAIFAAGILLRVVFAVVSPFKGGWWLDEGFSAALAIQPPAKIVRFAAADIHPPLYYLALAGWNRLGAAMLGAAPPNGEWIEFRHHPELTAGGEFHVRLRDGTVARYAGLFPEMRGDWPLAPVWFLRLSGVPIGLAAAWALLRVLRRVAPDDPAVAVGAAAMYLLSPFVATWDVALRSYGMQTAFVALALAAAHEARGRAAALALAAVSTAAALLAGYGSLMALPFVALALPLLLRERRRIVEAVAAIAAGGLAAALAWTGPFLRQMQFERVVSAQRHGVDRVRYELYMMADRPWRFLFGFGESWSLGFVDALVPWAVAAILVVACVYGAIVLLLKHRDRPALAMATLCFGPQLAVAALNVRQPGFVPHDARHLLFAAPWMMGLMAMGGSQAWRIWKSRKTQPPP